MRLTIYASGSRGNAANCLYTNKMIATDAESFARAVANDHVCAGFKGARRGIENFSSSDTVMMDIDNDHTEVPSEWITPEKLDELLPDVMYAMIPSRHHMQQKDRFSPRPRYHVYFEIALCRDVKAYSDLKRSIYEAMPFFDGNALDAARFSFGCVGEVIWHDGWITIVEALGEDTEDPFADMAAPGEVIPSGSRNNTMSRFAGRVLKRYGVCDKAEQLFRAEAAKCEPPLEESELGTIWASACRFAKKVQNEDGYVDPEKYNAEAQLCPEDYSDIGEAKVWSREYGNELIYTSATDFLRFDGTVWREDKQLAISAQIEFLDLQLAEAEDRIALAKDALLQAGVEKDAVTAGGKILEKAIGTPEQFFAFMRYKGAVTYQAFVMKHREMKNINYTLGVAKALLNHDINDMDRDPNLLNTPAGTYDLAEGVNSIRKHSADDRITKITECNAGEHGKQLWLDALDTFFCGNRELIDYVQTVVGMAAIGKVYQEHLIIAYGDGANGKSTFWNTVARVLGNYSGKISAEVLTVGNRRNAKPEMAELKGKRLIIASEMEEGMRLNTAMVKQLCSTDAIQAEKKYEKPFHFTPTHTLVLYTNHLPRVGANDDGIWRRLVVIPFEAKITGKSDVKNFSDYLFEEAGPAILTWIIEGAQKAIAQNFKTPLPRQVQDAIDAYRDKNDWFAQFVDDCCEVDESFNEPSGAVYDEYRNYCARVGEYTRNSSDFYAALEKAGFNRKRTKSARLIIGLRLKSEFLS